MSNDKKNEQLPAFSPLPEDQDIVNEIRSEVNRLRQDGPEMATQVVSELEKEDLDTMEQVMPVRSVSEVRPVALPEDPNKRTPDPEIPTPTEPSPEMPEQPVPQQEIPAQPMPSPEMMEEEELDYAEDDAEDYDDPYLYESEDDDRKKNKKEKKSRKKRKKEQFIQDEMENDIYYGVHIRSFEEIKREMKEKTPEVSEPTSKFTHLFDDTVQIPKGMLNEVSPVDTEELKRKREERAQMAMEEALADTALADETIETEEEFHEETIAPEFGYRKALPTEDDSAIVIDGFDYSEWKRTTQQIPVITDEMLETHKKTTYTEDDYSTLPVQVHTAPENSDPLPVSVANHAENPSESTMMELELLMEQALAPTEESTIEIEDTPTISAEEPVASTTEAPLYAEDAVTSDSVEAPIEEISEEPVKESFTESPVEDNHTETPANPVIAENPVPTMESDPEIEESIRAKVQAAMAEKTKTEEPVKKPIPVIKPAPMPHYTPVSDPERYRFHQIPVRTFRIDQINELIAGEMEMYRDPTIPPKTDDPILKEEQQEEQPLSSYGEVIALSTDGGIEAAIEAAIQQADRFEAMEAAEAARKAEEEAAAKEAARIAAEEEAAKKAAEEVARKAEEEAAAKEAARIAAEEEAAKKAAEEAARKAEEEAAAKEVARIAAEEVDSQTENEENAEPTPVAESSVEERNEESPPATEQETPVAEPTPVEEKEPFSSVTNELPDELKDLVETMEVTVAEETAAIEEAEAEAKAAAEAEQEKAAEESTVQEQPTEDKPAEETSETTDASAEHSEETTEPSTETSVETEEETADEDKPSEIFDKIAAFPKPAKKEELSKSPYPTMMMPPALEEIPAVDFEDEEDTKKKKRSTSHKKKSVTAKSFNKNEEPADEYNPNSDPKKISKELQTATKELHVRTFVTGFFTAALLVLGLVYEKFIPDSVTAMPYLIMNLAFIVIPAAVCCKTIWNGVKALFSLQGNTDSGISIAVLASIAQGIALFFNPELLMSGSVHVYGAVAVGALLVNTIGKLSMMNRIARNFIFVTSADKKCSVEIYEDINTAIQLAKGCVNEAPKIAYQRKVKFFKNFLNHSYASDPSMRTSQLIAPIALVASVVLGVVTAIITGNIITGITALSVATCISAPIASLLCVNLPVAKLCKLARRHGAMLVGYEAVEKLSHTNAVMLDSTDIFPKDSVSLADIKLYGGKKTERSILNAAAVMSNIGGTLRDLFEGVITSQKEMLPMATNIAYVEEQGMTGVVGGKKVLVGNRTMMYLNDVHMPADATPPMLAANQSVLYLAEDGELMAMLIVTYDPDHNTVHEMQRLEHCGIAAIVHTLDPNLTPEFLSTLFLVHENAIKVLPTELGKCCDEALQTEEEECDVLLATRGKSFSMMRMLSACIRQKHNISLSVTMQIVSVIVGFVLVAFLSCYAGLQQLSTLAILIYEAFWLAAIIIIPKLRKP